PPPQAPAARPPDTRRRIASFARHHPKAHRDRFFAAPAAQNDSSTPRADRRHPQACSQHLKHGTRNVRPIARWYGEIYGLGTPIARTWSSCKWQLVPTRKGVSNDATSAAYDRGHAGAEPIGEYTGVISSASLAVRVSF